ncbi:MAG: gephyrin-like molybdotransferase receptor GlpR [Gordonia sp. (in: high G+C Gram-positive bacteria)]|uniref:divisome protein SepX/GlpR n=1 Tax=Gordonia TaxID=2053 RepID=UPI00326561E9
MPTSVLWVTLIGVWLFVLVPMVLRGRPQARKTTEAAANTRLVHRGGSRSGQTRTATRTRAAQRAAAKAGEQADAVRRKTAAVAETDVEDAEADSVADVESADLESADVESADVESSEVDSTDAESDVEGAVAAEEIAAESDESDDDAVESIADDADESADAVSAVEMTDQIPLVADDVVDLDRAQAARVADTDVYRVEADDFDDIDEWIEVDEAYDADEAHDADEVVATDESDDTETEDLMIDDDAPAPREVRGRGGYGPERVAEREQMQYRERQRIVLVLAAVTLASIVAAFVLRPWGAVAAVTMVVVFGAYLFLLRRTVREEQMRQAQRAARRRRQQREDARLESLRAEPTYVEPPARLRRPGGAIVLEIDDEDPAFDHLPTYDFAYADRYDDEDYYDGYDDVDHRRTAV